MSVHVLPPRLIDDTAFPPERVVLAPDPLVSGQWLAWVVGPRGPVVLEFGSRDYARGDAVTFAARHGLDVEERAEAFGLAGIDRAFRQGGSR